MPTITPEVQTALYAEADVRFAAQYGIARKLNPAAPADQKWIPKWMAIYQAVLHEWQAGPIVWMHQHPAVAAAHAQAQAHQAAQPPQAQAAHDAAAYAAASQPARSLDLGPVTVTHVPYGPPSSAAPIDPYAAHAQAVAAAAQQLNKAAQIPSNAPGMTPPIASQAPASHVDPVYARAVAAAADKLAKAAAAMKSAHAQTAPEHATSHDAAAAAEGVSTGRIVLGVGIGVAFLSGIALLTHKADKRSRRRATVHR
jgi:hypothetical protein